MSALSARMLSTVVGVATLVAAGWVLGGAWWVAAGCGAAAVVAAQFDPRMTYPMVLAVLALTVAAAVEHPWLVVVVVTGAVGSIELAAGADRVTVVRRSVPVMGRVAASVAVAAALAGAVVLLGDLTWSRGDWAAIVAAAAAVVSVRLLAH